MKRLPVAGLLDAWFVGGRQAERMSLVASVALNSNDTQWLPRRDRLNEGKVTVLILESTSRVSRSGIYPIPGWR